MKLKKVDHVGIAVKDMDAAIRFYTEQLGVDKSDISDMVIEDIIRLATLKIGGANLELVQYLSQKEVLSQYADPQTDSIHHVGIFVDNLEETLSNIKKSGGTLIHEKPLVIPGGVKVAFALPRNSRVIFEFMEA